MEKRPVLVWRESAPQLEDGHAVANPTTDVEDLAGVAVHQVQLWKQEWSLVRARMQTPTGSRFCCGALLDSNTDCRNSTAPPAASAG